MNYLQQNPRKEESAIININDDDGRGTRWIAFKKHSDEILCFNSFGNLQPSSELVKYLNGGTAAGFIKYYHDRYQDYDTFEYGYLCL